MCPLTVILRMPLDWPMLLRGACPLPSLGHTHNPTNSPPYTIRTPTEYFAGANAAGPYLAAKALSELPFAYGPMLLATILYWMTGACLRARRDTVMVLRRVPRTRAAPRSIRR